MANRRRRGSPARLLAPLALVVAAVAILLVVQGTLGSDDDGSGRKPQRTTSVEQQQTQTTKQRVRPSYTVKLNDTLERISEKTGVSVARLEELNPELDPQNLIVGQKIKLRE
jgi:LysM repeat protein